VARRCVWSRNLENEEAKTRYRALKIQPQWVVTPRKHTNMLCHARFEIITVVLMKIEVIWNTMFCVLVIIITDISQKFLLLSLGCRQSRLLLERQQVSPKRNWTIYKSAHLHPGWLRYSDFFAFSFLLVIHIVNTDYLYVLGGALVTLVTVSQVRLRLYASELTKCLIRSWFLNCRW